MKRYLSYIEFVDWYVSASRAIGLDGDRLRYGEKNLRLPLILRQVQNLDELDEAIDEPACYGLMLMQAGRASVAVIKADQVLVSKQIQKYMVRKSQGKAQLTYLHEKGKSRLGSRIRLQQTKEFFQEINERMLGYAADYELEQVFISCTPKLKGAFFLATDRPAIAKADPRWRRVPFTLRPPGQVEMLRMIRLLGRAEWLP